MFDYVAVPLAPKTATSFSALGSVYQSPRPLKSKIYLSTPINYSVYVLFLKHLH